MANLLRFAPEGAGNHLVQNILERHPGIRVTGRSLPHSRMGGQHAPDAPSGRGTGIWPGFQWLKSADAVVLCNRSCVHAVYSSWRRFYRDPEDKRRFWTPAGLPQFLWQYNAALEWMYHAQIAHPNCLVTTYEEITAAPREWMRTVSDWLGLPDRWDVSSLKVENRNDDRWAEDDKFRTEWEKYNG